MGHRDPFPSRVISLRNRSRCLNAATGADETLFDKYAPLPRRHSRIGPERGRVKAPAYCLIAEHLTISRDGTGGPYSWRQNVPHRSPLSAEMKIKCVPPMCFPEWISASLTVGGEMRFDFTRIHHREVDDSKRKNIFRGRALSHAGNYY